MLYPGYLAEMGQRDIQAYAGYGEIGFPEPTTGVRVVVRGCVLMGIGNERYRPCW